MRSLRNPAFIRGCLVVLLLGGSYFAALPWTNCAFALRRWVPDLVRVCTFGSGNAVFDRSGPGPLWPYPLAAAIYVLAALAIAFVGRVDLRRSDRGGV